MSHKKAGGSTNNGRDSVAQRLGVKVFGDQAVKAGGIIIRQRGTKYFPGDNTDMGKDHTIFSKIEGKVSLYRPSNKNLDFDLPLVFSENKLLIPDNRLLEGRWDISVIWEYEGVKYLFKDKVMY